MSGPYWRDGEYHTEHESQPGMLALEAENKRLRAEVERLNRLLKEWDSYRDGPEREDPQCP